MTIHIRMFDKPRKPNKKVTQMKAYTFLIGSADDFDSLDHMLDHFENDASGIHKNCAAYDFDVPAACDKETVTMVGRGIAFSNDWCIDHTYSCVVEGGLEDKTSSQTQMHDLWE
jgi:hypothetical protein